MIQAVVSCVAHYDLLAFCGNSVSLGQIQGADEIWKETTEDVDTKRDSIFNCIGDRNYK